MAVWRREVDGPGKTEGVGEAGEVPGVSPRVVAEVQTAEEVVRKGERLGKRENEEEAETKEQEFGNGMVERTREAWEEDDCSKSR